MIIFPRWICSDVIKNMTERPALEKPFIRVSPLFFGLGGYAYQVGGLLGYSLKGKPVLLIKLLGSTSTPNTEKIIKYLEELSVKVEDDLEENKDKNHNFLQLYVLGESKRMGFDITTLTLDERNKKVESSGDTETIFLGAFHKGVSLGFFFPKEFSEYWEYTSNTLTPRELWKFTGDHGLDIPEKQEPTALNEAVAGIANNAIMWGNNFAPNVLDNDDINMLKELALVNSK